MKKSVFFVGVGIVLLVLSAIESPGQRMPQMGDLLITEIMVNPSKVSDTKGEWIEIFNLSLEDLVLNGLVLSDAGSNSHIISSEPEIIIPRGQFFVLGRSDSRMENGGLEVNYVYTNFSLGNTEDEIILSLPDGSVLDALHYDSSWPVVSGASMELDPEIADPAENDSSEKWHPGIDLYGDGDLGSPGRTNSFSTGLFKEGLSHFLEVFPNPCQGSILIRISNKIEDSLSIHLISLLGQRIPILEDRRQRDFLIPLDLSGWKSGLYWLEIKVGKEVYVQKIIIQNTQE